MKPKYKHNCKCCVFLGPDTSGDDVYWCPSHAVPWSLTPSRREECVLLQHNRHWSDFVVYERSYWRHVGVKLLYTRSLISMAVRAGYIDKSDIDAVFAGVLSE